MRPALICTLAIIFLLSAFGRESSLQAQGSVTTTRPITRPAAAAPVVAPATPLTAASSGGLSDGTYQLRLHYAPGGDESSAITRLIDVHVKSSGNTLTMATDNAADMLTATVTGTHFAANGSDAGLSLVLDGTLTPAGATGTFTLGSGTRTGQGPFSLTRVHQAQLHKIETFGSGAGTTAPPSKSLWQQIKDAWNGFHIL